MPATVFMTDLSANAKVNVPKKVSHLFDRLDAHKVFSKRDLIAVKLHLGEPGNLAYIRPQCVRSVVERLRDIKTKPFLTDTNTLYIGQRIEAWSHLNAAFDNGFTRDVTRAPVLIADGLRGNNHVDVPVNGKHVGMAHIAADIHYADGLVVLTHFKGHELTGFGGAIKNVGMGCGRGKESFEQHSNISPAVAKKKCIGCGECVPWCRGQAISLEEHEGRKKARINPEKCVGCAECILTCDQGAIQIQWNETVPVFMEKMVEYSSAVIRPKNGKVLYMTFVTDVSPLCDCYPFSDRAIVPNLGILASTDLVAIDQAAADLVNNAPGNPLSALTGAMEPGQDKFKALFPAVDWSRQLQDAEEMGLGSGLTTW